MKTPRRIPYTVLIIAGAFAVLTILVLAGRVTWFSEEPPVEFLDNMDLNPKAIPQSGYTFFADGKSFRDPIEGTVARGVDVYPLQQGDIEAAETLNVDPQLERTDFVLARGQNRFNTFCSPCHNYNAQGGSRVATRGEWAGIPDLTRDLTRDLSNARIYHIVSAGQNLMPSYADKISPIDRWTIVYYLRTLQAAGSAQ
jgi:mono/diheme cytochrome c family protein